MKLIKLLLTTLLLSTVSAQTLADWVEGNAWAYGNDGYTEWVLLGSYNGSQSFGFRCVDTVPELVYMPNAPHKPNQVFAYASEETLTGHLIQGYSYSDTVLANFNDEDARNAYEFVKSLDHGHTMSLAVEDINGLPITGWFKIPTLEHELACF